MPDLKIKIYVTCLNNKILLPDNALFELVQGGSAIAKQRLPGMLHDDEGDNISELNPRFNDAATMYWVWKNFDNDYYGFFQYRRFLSFDTKMLKERQYEYPFDTNDEKAFVKMHLTDEAEMRAFIEKYDIITCNYIQYDTSFYSLYQQYYEVPYTHERDLDLMLEILQEKYPEYMPAARESLFNNGKGYFANLFIMKKPYFQQLCQWMFDILLEFDRRMDYSEYSFAERRAPGFLSERLIGIFYTYLEMETKCKFGILQKCFFKSTREQPLEPKFEDKGSAVPIVLSASKQYLPYCGVTVQSIIEHAASDKFYDIVILNEDITNHAIKRFTAGLIGQNISIRFVNVTSYFVGQGIDTNRLSDPKEAYYRCFIGDVMEHYDRAIYLDSDVIVKRDIGELLKAELNGNPVAVGQDRKGVIKPAIFVCDIKQYRKIIGGDNLLALLDKKSAFKDVFCSAFSRWAIIQDLESWVIHFDGKKKPWKEDSERNKVFWKMAERSPLYQDIKDRLEMKRFDQYFPGYIPGKKEQQKIRPWEFLLDDTPFPILDLSPAFKENNVAVMMQSSQYYLPFTAVTIQSLVESGDAGKNYDVIVFTDGIEKKKKEKLLKMTCTYDNLSIRVVNVSEVMILLNNPMLQQYSKLSFCRVLLAHLLPKYEQIICVDGDMLVVSDVGVFNQYEFNGDLVLAAHEWCYDSYGEELKLNDYRKEAFNAGFMVLNLRDIRKRFSAAELIELCNARNWKYLEQDVLNVLCSGKIQYLNYDWNYRIDLQSCGALQITECLNNSNYKILSPKVIHFAGASKPWSISGLEYEELFWDVAGRSTFYRDILFERFSSSNRAATTMALSAPQVQPNLIPVNHPGRKYLDFIMPKGSRRREFAKRLVRLFREK